MSAKTTHLLSSGEFCKLRCDTIPVKSASGSVSFYTNNSKMPNFELWHFCLKWAIYIFSPMPPHVLVDFVVLPPGHGRSVTDFWVWDDHEAQLRCPDVSDDIVGCSARKALKPKFYQPIQTMVTAGILPFRGNTYGRTGNRTRGLMISITLIITPTIALT